MHAEIRSISFVVTRNQVLPVLSYSFLGYMLSNSVTITILQEISAFFVLF